MAQEIHKHLLDASVAAEQLREMLFGISQNAMRGGDSDWNLIEGLFSLIKQAELLRRDIDSLRGLDVSRGAHDVLSIRPPARQRVSKQGYPKYSLRDGSVVRTGIGQNGLEYEHVVKRRDFEKIIEVINRFVKNEGFSVDEVLKGLDLPSYLTYLVVSLLKEKLGKLESPKRGRYRFKESQPMNTDALIEDLRILGEQETA